MEPSKDILDKLTTAQLNSFIKYLQSPYYNNDTALFSYAEKRIWELKQGIRQMVRSEAKEQKLQSHCLNFLVFEYLRRNKSFEAQLKLSAARKRNLEKLYNGIISDIGRLRKAEFDQSSEFYYNQYLIEKNLFELTTENEKKNAKVNIAASLNIDKIAFHLDIYYFLEKAKHHLRLGIHRSIDYNNKSNVDFFTELYDFYKEKDCPLLNIVLLTGFIASGGGNHDPNHSVLLLNKIKSFIHHIPLDDAKLIAYTLSSEKYYNEQPVVREIIDMLNNQIRFIESLNQPNLN